MAKKITVIVISILVVACSALGLYVCFSDDSNVSNTDESTQAVTENRTVEIVPDETKPTTQQTTQPSQEKSDATYDWLTAHTFTLMGVHDNQLDMDVQPRVVFGKGCIASECYLKFDENGKFEMSIGGFSGVDANGTYTVKGDIISVTFSDGSIAEYDIKRNYEGAIDSIVVPINEYSVFFWY